MPRCLASQPRGGSGPKYLAAFRPQHLSSSLELRHVRQALHESSAALAVSASLKPLDCIACQAPPSVGFSRQECWSGLPLPSPGDLPDPGIEPTSLTSPALAGGFFTPSATCLINLSESQDCGEVTDVGKGNIHLEICLKGSGWCFGWREGSPEEAESF